DLLYAGVDGGQRGVGVDRDRGRQAVDFLLPLYQAPIELRGRSQIEVVEGVQGRQVLLGFRKRWTVKGNGDYRQRVRLPLDVSVLRPLEGAFGGDRGFEAASLPGAPVFFDQANRLLGIHVSGDDQRGVLGAVPAIEEQLRVLELVGHVLDVFEEAHRGVLVGVGVERG